MKSVRDGLCVTERLVIGMSRYDIHAQRETAIFDESLHENDQVEKHHREVVGRASSTQCVKWLEEHAS